MDNITLDALMAQLGEANSKILPVAESVAKRLKADYNMSVDSSEYVLKDSIPDIPDIPENDFKNTDRKHTIVSYINTIAKDRDDEVVLPEGATLDDYRRLPVVLFGHRYDELGVGSNEWIVSTDRNNNDKNYGLIAQTLYASKKANPFGDQIYNWRLEDMPMGESIGFVPVEFVTPDDKGWDKLHDGWVKRVTAFLKSKGMEVGADVLEGINRIFTKWLLLEYSDVMVPSNAHAVTLAVQKGLITNDDIERYTIKTPDDELEKTPIYANGEKIADLIIPPTAYSTATSVYDSKGEVENNSDLTLQIDPLSALRDPKAKEIIEGFVNDTTTVTKPEATEEYHRIPVNECTITATIDIDKEKGIKALYCGDDKKVGTYLFDKEKWSMAEAKAWVADHKDAKAEVDFYEKAAAEKAAFDMSEGVDKLALELKEGRVISAKNKVILQNTYDATMKACEALDKLLKATEQAVDDIDLAAIEDKSIDDIDLEDIDVTPVSNIDWGNALLVKNDDISLSDADIEELTGLIAENMDMDVITSMVVDKFVTAKADESEAVPTIPSPLDLLSTARGKVISLDTE